MSKNSCSFCRETKRKCNGEKPSCSNCIQYKQLCYYTLLKQDHDQTSNSDRRRRKYHTDYITSLELQSTKLTDFIKQFVKDDPRLNELLNDKLNDLSKFEQEQNQQIQSSINDFDELNEILKQTEKLSINDHNDINPYFSELEETLLNHPNLTNSPLLISNQMITITEPNYQLYILRLFKHNFAIHSPPLIKISTYYETLNYNDLSLQPTQKLLFNLILGIGNLYSSHENKLSHELYFISLAKDTLMEVICKSKVDIYSIMSIYLFSTYELSINNNLSQSYLFDSIACSLTQHMGLHISYEDSKYAPKQSPFNLAILWSVCSQDRLITGFLKVPCVLHFKRIISPFYHVVTDNDNIYHIAELFFSYNVRLSYIYDRFTDQIFTNNFDFGDSNNKSKLLSMGLKTLEELKESLPISLRISSLNDSSNDFYIYLFNFNYQVTLIDFNKLFLKEISNIPIIKKSIVNSTLEASKLLLMFESNDEFISKLPYYSPNYINTVGLILIFLLSIETKEQEFDKLSFHFQTVKNLLNKLSPIFRSSIKFLNNLNQLIIKNGLSSKIINIPNMLPTLDESPTQFQESTDDLFSQWEKLFPEFNQSFPNISPNSVFINNDNNNDTNNSNNDNNNNNRNNNNNGDIGNHESLDEQIIFKMNQLEKD